MAVVPDLKRMVIDIFNPLKGPFVRFIIINASGLSEIGSDVQQSIISFE